MNSVADYLTARAAIASIIGAVTIASPVAAALSGNVYETRPDAQDINRYPAVVITGYTSQYLRGVGKRERRYSVGLMVAVKPIDGATAEAQLQALKEAIATAFDAKVSLGISGGYHVIEGPNWISKESLEDGGITWDEGEILIALKDTAAFVA